MRGLGGFLLCVAYILAVAAADVPTLGVIWFDYGAACQNIRTFSAAHYTAARINLTCSSVADWYPLTMPDLKGETAPYKYDVVILDSQWIGEAAEGDLIYSFNDVIRDPAVRASDFYEGALASYSEYPEGSKQYWGIPFQADVNVILVRKDLFTKYKRDYPMTTEELLQAAEFFKSSAVPEVRDGFAAFWCSTDGDDHDCYDETPGIWNQFAWMEGGQLWDEKSYMFEGVANSEANARALEYIKRLYKAGKGYPKNSFMGAVEDFCSGKAAMSMIWSGYAELMQSEACRDQFGGTYNVSDVDVIPLPYNAATGIYSLQIGGMGAHVSKRSAYPEQAKQFATWLGSVQYQTLAAGSGARTVRKSVSSDTRFWTDANGRFSKPNAVFFQSYPKVRDFYRLPIYASLLNLEMKYLHKALEGKMDSHTALALMASEQQAVIDKTYPCGSPYAPSLVCSKPQPEYNWSLLVLSYCVSVLGSWTASILLEEVSVSGGKKDRCGVHATLIIAGLVLGSCGVWALHAIAISALGYAHVPEHTFEAAPAGTALLISVLLATVGLGISAITLRSTKTNVVQRFLSPVGRGPLMLPTTNTPGAAIATVSLAYDENAPFLSKCKWLITKIDACILLGSLFLVGAIEGTLYGIFQGYRSQIHISSNPGVLAASVIVCYPHTILALLLMWHLPKGKWRFSASFVMANNALISYIIHVAALQAHAEKVAPEPAQWTPSELTLGASIAAALTCFLSMGLNVTRMKLSRAALMTILSRNNKEMDSLKADILERDQLLKLTTHQQIQATRALAAITLCRRARMTNHAVALALAEIKSFEVPSSLVSSVKQKSTTAGTWNARMSMPSLGVVDEESLDKVMTKLENIGTGGLQSGPVPQLVTEQVTLTEVLSHPATIELFKDYLHSKHNEENLLFLLDMREYRRMTNRKVKQELAEAIFQTYVQDGASCQINVSDAMRGVCQRRMELGDPECFDAIANELSNLIQANDWLGFTDTPAYKLCAVILEHPAFTVRDEVSIDEMRLQKMNSQNSLGMPGSVNSGSGPNVHKSQDSKEHLNTVPPLRPIGRTATYLATAPTVSQNLSAVLARDTPDLHRSTPSVPLSPSHHLRQPTQYE